MLRAGLAVLVASATCLALVAACTTFGAGPTPASAEGGSDRSDRSDASDGASFTACQLPCTIADDPAGPYAIAVDATYVYWTTPTSGTVSRKRKDARDDLQKIAFGQAAPKAITVSPTDVYWANTGTDGGHPGAIVSQSLSCAANACLTDALRINTTFVRWDDGFLYYVRDAFFGRYDGKDAGDLCDMGIPIAGAAVGTNLLIANTAGPPLIEACPKTPRADASTANIVISNGQPRPLAAVGVAPSDAAGSISGSDVYISFAGDQSAGGGTSVAHVTATGQLSPVIASGQNDTHAIVVDDTYVFWTATGDGAVRRRRRDGTGGIDDLATGETEPTDLTTDGVALYWVTAHGIRSRVK